MNTLTVADLKEKLKKKNLSTAGTKSELVKRLLEAGVPMEELCVSGPSESGEAREEQSDGSQVDLGATTELSRRQVELLRRERDLATREAELLRRELAQLRMTPPAEEDAPVRAGVKKWKELENLVSTFDGNGLDLDRWERQLRRLLSSYTLDEHQAKALVCSRLTGKALRWYHSRIDCVELSCEDLLREVRKMYGQRIDPLVLRRELEARKWSANEVFADYLHDKVTLANRIPVADNELISYVIEGIPSQELRTQARVQQYETIDEMLAAFANVPSPKDTSRQQLAEKSKSQSKEQRVPKQSDVRRCYNCGEEGHIAAGCPKPRRERGSCFECGKFGHRATQCTVSKDVNCVEPERQEDNDFRRAVDLRLSKGNVSFKMSFNALIDSGSPISFVKEGFIPRAYVEDEANDDQFCGLNGSGLKVIGRVKAELMFENREFNVILRVVPDGTMRSPMVLGRDFLSMAKLSLKSEDEVVEDEVVDIMNIEIAEDDLRLTSRNICINEDLSVEVKAEARALFDKCYVYAERPPKPATENALSITPNKKETNPRIARWALETQNYDHVLEHRPGSRMLHVDALSRQICVIKDNTFNRNLALCQNDDPPIAEIRKELKRPWTPG